MTTNLGKGKPAITDVEYIEEILGEFPAAIIEACFRERGINIATEKIPRGFSKYFSLMRALSGDLQGKNLLDFGCGLGVFSAQASRLGMQAEGIDIFTEYQGACFEAAQCIASSISPSCPPRLTKLNFLTEGIKRDADFVTSFGMLEHIFRSEVRHEILKKMMDTLKPGGYFILTCGPNIRFPFDLHHYGPRFIFYHCLSEKLRGVYLRVFAGSGQNQDPKWLNGMSVREIRNSIVSLGGENVEQLFPLWVSLARARLLRNKVIRWLSVFVARLLAGIEAEPVIIIVARKRG